MRHTGRPGTAGGVLAAFVLLSTVVTVVVAVTAVVGRDDPYPTGIVWLDGSFHGDALWYCRIAAGGNSYTPGQQSPVAFFPVFPMLLRGWVPCWAATTGSRVR